MKIVRPFLVLVALITLLVAASAHAQVTYDGHCYTNVVQDAGDQTVVEPYAEYVCSGTFIGAMKVELQVEYYPRDPYSKVTLSPQGYISSTYYGSGVPSYDWLVTVAPRNPNYYSRGVLKVSWETDHLGCNQYGCYRIWDSDTLASPWN